MRQSNEASESLETIVTRNLETGLAEISIYSGYENFIRSKTRLALDIRFEEFKKTFSSHAYIWNGKAEPPPQSPTHYIFNEKTWKNEPLPVRKKALLTSLMETARAREEFFLILSGMENELNDLYRASSPMGKTQFKKPNILPVHIPSGSPVWNHIVNQDYGSAMHVFREQYIKQVGISETMLNTLKYGSWALAIPSVGLTAYEIAKSEDPLWETEHQSTLLASGFIGSLHAGRMALMPCGGAAATGVGYLACVGGASLLGGIFGTEAGEQIWQASDKLYSHLENFVKSGYKGISNFLINEPLASELYSSTQYNEPAVNLFKEVSLLNKKISTIPSTEAFLFDSQSFNQNPEFGKEQGTLKKAKKQAKKFVNKHQKTEAQSSTIDKDQAEKQFTKIADALMNAAVQQSLAYYSNDPKVRQFYENYVQAPNRTKAFIHFYQNLSDHDRVKQLFSAGKSTSVFLKEIALLGENNLMGDIAQGLSATVDFISGFDKAADAFSMIETAGELTLNSFSLMMGGLGLIAGGFRILTSLFGPKEEANNGMQVLYSAMMALWSDMRNRFEHTWKMLSVIDNKLELIEKQNRQQFEYTIRTIEQTHREIVMKLSHSEQKILGWVAGGYDIFKSYLDHIVDTDAQKVIQLFVKSEPVIIKENLNNWVTSLHLWLTKTAKQAGRSGYIERSHRQLAIDDSSLIQRLEKIIAPERSPIAAPLGLYASLLADFPIFSKFENMDFINFQDWFEMLEVYLVMLNMGKEVIENASMGVQQGYFAEILRVKDIVDNTIRFFSQLTQSESFWEQLMDRYQNHFRIFKQKLILAAESERRKMDQLHNVSEAYTLLCLNETAIESLEKIKNTNPQIFTDLTRELRESGMNVNWMPADVPKVSWSNTGEEEVTLQYLKPWEEICADVTIDRYLMALIRDPRFALAYAYQQAVIKVKSFLRKNQQVWNWPDNLFHTDTDYRTLFILNIAGKLSVPVCEHTKTWRRRHDIEQYFYSDHHFHRHGYSRRSELDTFQPDQLLEVVETNVLVPARKKLVSAIDTETSFEILALPIKKDYLRAMAFVQLMDPTFTPSRNPKVLNRLRTAITALLNEGRAADYHKLLAELPDHLWKEELHTHFGESFDNFSLPVMVKTLKKNLIFHPLWQKLTVAQAQIESILFILGMKTDLDHSLKQLINNLKLALDQQNRLNRAFNNLNQILPLLQIDTESQLILSSKKIVQLSLENNLLMQQLYTLESYLQRILFNQTLFEPMILPEEVFQEQEEVEPIFAVNITSSEALHQLCVNNETKSEQFIEELKKLESEHRLMSVLNKGSLANRPLHLAIQMGRVDLVSLLLAYDAKIEEETMELMSQQLLPKPIRYSMKALLDFYSYLQNLQLGDNLAVGRILSLTQQILVALVPFVDLENAVIFDGPSGAGKGSLINALLNVSYERLFDDQDAHEYLSPIGEIAEKVKTSPHGRSDTVYPQIINVGEDHLVDMPGFRSTFGVIWDIVTGLSHILLGQSFKTIKALVWTCEANDLYSTRFQGAKDPFIKLGKIINQQPELMQNLVFIVNKASPAQMKAGLPALLKRLEKFLSDNQEDVPEATQFVLKNLIHPNIFLVDIPDKQFRDSFYDRLKEIEKKPFSKFNFNSFHDSVEKLKLLLIRINDYRKQIQEDLNLTRNQMTYLISTNLDEMKKGLLAVNFTLPDNSTEYEETALLTQASLRLLNQQLDTRHKLLELKQIAFNISQPTSNYVLPLFPNYNAIIDKLRGESALVKVIEKFFNDSTPILDYLQLTTKTTNTSEETAPPLFESTSGFKSENNEEQCPNQDPVYSLFSNERPVVEDSQIMLGAVLLKSIRNVCVWTRSLFCSAPQGMTNVLSKTEFERRLKLLNESIATLERQYNKLPSVQRQQHFHWLEFVLKEHYATLCEIQHNNRGYSDILDELEQEIENTQVEFYQDLCNPDYLKIYESSAISESCVSFFNSYPNYQGGNIIIRQKMQGSTPTKGAFQKEIDQNLGGLPLGR